MVSRTTDENFSKVEGTCSALEKLELIRTKCDLIWKSKE
ncbi:hypothetical protein BVRB_2g037270 [Beta vulgaris subsp. vulgaris]|nr:hypothetical protein BVRB_2g037270 [Beta vulgaris subsp. vulgaris]